ncbi:T9SS type A sorting domain-containing protein [Flavivirga aquimarina]|uniref:T9SS type A sorting domain-containing protein n=1 Tax=Flavivirga aquimarina TaxID=2027862 RepID=A0ABT8W9J0_9FLAO|nr:T9SS type A sorting domain-containing protein [Flavivirga aquimarina]MDO5969805.1 T9SS type A sorting domain-containing protein [Flavivirga aquimarina]
MKKLVLLLLLMPVLQNNFAQTYSTGVVALDTDYTVQFDVNTTSNIVTMTMIGPDNIWLGVGPGISTGLGMGNLGDDAIVYNSIGLQDRNMPSGTGTPNLDSSQDWNISSNTTNSNVRTLIATRAINTGDSNDYIFPSTATSIPILWAKGSSLTFGYHGSNKSGTVANLTLGTDDYVLNQFKIFPNPGKTIMNFQLPPSISEANIEVYDTLGKQIYNSYHIDDSKIDISKWGTGLYLIKVSSLGNTKTKRFLKI